VPSAPDKRKAALSFELLDDRIRGAVELVSSTDPKPSDPFRGLYVSDDLARTLARTPAAAHVDARLRAAARLLGLNALERAVLGLCAAPEISPHYGRLFSYLHDDVTRKLATPRLVARLLAQDGVAPDDVLACLGHDRPLRRRGAVQIGSGDRLMPLAERPVKVADRLATFLLGVELHDPPTAGRLRRVDLPEYEIGRAEAVQSLAALLRAESLLPIVVVGPDSELVLAAALNSSLVVLQAADVEDADLMREGALVAALEGRRLVFDGVERIEHESRARVLKTLTSLDEQVLICARSTDAVAALGDATALVVEVPRPSFAERKTAWSALSGAEAVADVAAKFRLSIGQIATASEVASLTARARGDELPSPADLDLGGRRASTTRLAELAARLDAAFDWGSIVLPPRQLDILHSISSYLRHRDLVLSDWGYERTVSQSQGLKVLFAGESGTGKTMAAQVLGRDLGLDLFRIDLATTVSKYIGETEKNLDEIFAAADGSNAILFFDEADALFGKRSEVKDSHDRYANIEVAYLLQKMESYPGAVILATNFRENIDEAFLRRLDFVVDFPFPEAEDREAIWRLLLPEGAPLATDIDIPFLANQFKLTGGNIRNVSLAGAFLAADDGGVIEMRHLIRGVALEFGKLGRLTLKSDFERFHELIHPGKGAGNGDAQAAAKPKRTAKAKAKPRSRRTKAG
jgi:hypothetical protein